MLSGSRKRNSIMRGASLNCTRSPQLYNSRKGGFVVQAATISFSGGNSIADSANGLGSFTTALGVQVQGSAANNRPELITAAAAGALTCLPAALTNAAATPTITLRSF